MLKSKNEFILIELIDVPERYRKNVGDLTDLKDSITSMGLINPITILEADAGRFTLLAGERRLKSYTELGFKEIPCTIYTHLTELDMHYIELDENYQRENFSYSEEVALKKKIYEMEKKHNPKTSIRSLATKLDINRQTLNTDIKLAEAIEFMPTLADCKNKHEALKKYDQFEAEVAQQVYHQRMKIKADAEDDGMKNVLDVLFKVGDATEGIKKQKDMSYQLVELDPPYGIEYDKLTQDEMRKKTFTGWKRKEFMETMPIILAESFRILKTNGWLLLWFSMRYYADLTKMLDEVGFRYDATPIVWNKSTGRSNSPRTMFNQSCEFCLYARKGNASLLKKGHPIVFTHKVEHDSMHATPKPISMYEELFECFVMEGAKAYSAYLGSGNIILGGLKRDIMVTGYDLYEENKQNFLIKSKKVL